MEKQLRLRQTIHHDLEKVRAQQQLLVRRKAVRTQNENRYGRLRALSHRGSHSNEEAQFLFSVYGKQTLEEMKALEAMD